MRMTKKITSIVLAVLMVVSMMSVMAVTTASAANVAKIGTTNYESFEAAWNAAQDGDTITLLADSEGNGLIAPQGKYTQGLTVDFNGKTYSVTGNLVGSSGTQTQAFQLLKDNNITFKNGTIYSEKAKMLVQNYSNLTLDNMTLTLNNPNYAYGYTLSNNNGNTVIKDTTINANPAGGFAFDACRFSSYPSVRVTVTGDSKINGNVEVTASGNDVKDGLSLNLENGTMAGEVKISSAVQAAIDADPDSNFTTDTTNFETVTPVAEIGAAKFATLEDALDFVPDGGTVTVLKDIATSGNIFADGFVSGGNRTYTVDLGSYTVSGGTFIVADGNDVTFTNGTIESASYAIQNTATATVDSTATVKSTATDASAVFGAEGSTTNINGTVEGNKYGVIARGGTLNVAGKVTATNDDGRAITLNKGGAADINDGADIDGAYGVVVHKDATLNVNGGDIAGVYHAVSGNGTAADGPYTINVTGGTLTATNGAGIYNPNAKGTMNISGGTITGSTTAVAAGANSTNNISGGTFSSAVPEEYCANGFVPKDNGNGTYGVGPDTSSPLNPLMVAAADINDHNAFEINSDYLKGTLLGVQKKNAIDDAAITSESHQENGSDMRFIAVLDTELLQGADDYGFILGKVDGSRTYTDTNINKLVEGAATGIKKISAKGTYNTVCGTSEEAMAYGNPAADTPYKYVTCAVNGVDDGKKVVARFYYTKDGKTYFAKYAGQNYQYTGCMAGISAAGNIY